ncbi:WecB UDP-N-acetylglucosamine 2-epimerase [Methylophilaceae bacterium]
MKKLKVLTVVGTRPEIIRLSRVIARLDQFCDHILVHTGQNYDYELNQIFFDDLGIHKPDYFLNSTEESSSPAQTIGNILIAIDKVLEKIKPDAMLVLGDTNSCLSVIPAKRRKIPIFHMEAGNRCFDQRVPEEINRHIVDHVADINLTYSTIARDYLIREGIAPAMVIKIGSPMHEVLTHYRLNIEESDILKREGLKEGKYFLVSAHREENIDPPQSFKKFIQILNGIAEDYNIPVIVSTHPRTKKRIDAENITFHSKIRLLKPLGFFDFMKLQICAHTTLSDSGTINEESSIMNFPALNLRETHERPEAMEEAAVMMVGLNIARVNQGLMILANQSRGLDRTASMNPVFDYTVTNVSDKLVRIIHSYTDYVNRVIWKKY